MSAAPHPRSEEDAPSHRPLVDTEPFFMETRSGTALHGKRRFKLTLAFRVAEARVVPVSPRVLACMPY
jgi:hypothetical protein